MLSLTVGTSDGQTFDRFASTGDLAPLSGEADARCLVKLESGETVFFNSSVGTFADAGGIYVWDQSTSSLTRHTDPTALSENATGGNWTIDRCEAAATDGNGTVYFSLYSSDFEADTHYVYRTSAADATDWSVEEVSRATGLATVGGSLYLTGSTSEVDKPETEPSEVVNTVEDAFRSFWKGVYESQAMGIGTQSYAPGPHLDMMGGASTTTNVVSDFVGYSAKPMEEIENASDYSGVGAMLVPWNNLNKALFLSNKVLEEIENGGLEVIVGGEDQTERVHAAAYLARGLAHGYLSNLFDQAYIIETGDNIAALELSPYSDVIDQAIGDLQEAGDIASQNSFDLEGVLPWKNSPPTADQVVRIAKTMSARFVVQNSRTLDENTGSTIGGSEQYGWNDVLEWTQNGVQQDISLQLTTDPYEDDYAALSTLINWYYRVDHRIINLMDPDYPARYPVDRAENAEAIPEADSEDDRICNEPKSLDTDGGFGDIVGVERDPENCFYIYTNDFSIVFNAGRDGSSFSTYWWAPQWATTIGNEEPLAGGPRPLFLVNENRTLQAEAEIRASNGGGVSAAEQIINDGSRTNVGNLPPLDGASENEVLRAIYYERAVQLARTVPALTWADLRRRDALFEGTPKHLPVPANELEFAGETVYSFGGVENASEPGTASGDQAWCTGDNPLVGNTVPFTGCDPSGYSAPSASGTSSSDSKARTIVDAPDEVRTPVLSSPTSESGESLSRLRAQSSRTDLEDGIYRIDLDLSGTLESVATNENLSIETALTANVDGELLGYSTEQGSGDLESVLVRLDPSADAPSFAPVVDQVSSVLDLGTVRDLSFTDYRGTEELLMTYGPAGADQSIARINAANEFILGTVSVNPIFGHTGGTFAQAPMAVSGSGEVLLASQAGTITQVKFRPAPPRLIGSEGDGVAHLNWTPETEFGLVRYDVYRSETAFSDTSSATLVQSVPVIDTLETGSADEGLDNETTYHYRVVAIDRGEVEPARGGASERVSVTPTTPAASASVLVDQDGEQDFTEAVDISFSGVQGSAEVSTQRFDSAPAGQEGIREENVSSYRFVIKAIPEGEGFDFDEAELRFDVFELAGITENPSETETTLYQRSPVGFGRFEDTSLFYDGDSGELVGSPLSLISLGESSEFVLGSDSNPLPVELASFEGTATDEGIRLIWQTASETNNSGFDVQRREGEPGQAKGSSWTTVGFVEGAGTTSEPQSYQFTDEDLPYDACRLTYRLKQIDTDGTTTLSDPVTIERNVSEVELLGTFPNPASQQATVRYALPAQQDVQIRLYDALGRQVRTMVNGQKEGRQEETIDVSGLSSGTYFLRLQAESATKSQQVTVVR